MSNVHQIYQLLMIKQKNNTFHEKAFDYCKKNHKYKMINIIVNHNININSKNEEGDTLLIIACRYSHVAIVNTLITFKADANIKNNNGDSALLVLCSSYRPNWMVMSSLYHARADVNLKNNNGETALMKLCMYNNCYNMQASSLILRKADINLLSNDGNSALTIILNKLRPFLNSSDYLDEIEHKNKLLICEEDEKNQIHYVHKSSISSIDSILGDLKNDSHKKILSNCTDTLQILFNEYIEEIDVNSPKWYRDDNFVVINTILKVDIDFYRKITIGIQKMIAEEIINELNDPLSSLYQSFKNNGELNLIQIIVDYVIYCKN